MTPQPKNEAFAQTSFLQGANAAYIEEMQAQYERNPGSVTDEWRHFFASLKEERAPQEGNGHGGPSWATPLAALQEKSELLDALTGDWGGVERGVGDRPKAGGRQRGHQLERHVLDREVSQV